MDTTKIKTNNNAELVLLDNIDILELLGNESSTRCTTAKQFDVPVKRITEEPICEYPFDDWREWRESGWKDSKLLFRTIAKDTSDRNKLLDSEYYAVMQFINEHVQQNYQCKFYGTN